MTEDSELLRCYAENRSETAFAEFVNRRIALVYSVALRQVGGDVHLAQDVTQRVFSDLARKASSLARRPVLTGWLYRSTHFAASDIVRSERRRRAREEEHFQMNQMIAGAEGGQTDWSRLRPVIDDAMAELDDEDRDAVALRFLEDKSFAEIGRALHLSEDTARKRVERALDRLQGALAKRGVSSTTQALALALANQAAAAVPAGLAATVTAGALTGAAGAIGAGIFHLMITSKAALGVLGIGAAAAAGFAIVERQAARETQAALAALTVQRDSLQAKVQVLETRLNAEAKRAAAAEEDNAKLLGAVQKVQSAQAAAEAAPITRDVVEARYKRAQELAKTGRSDEALREYLWCYDEGMPRVTGYSGVRSSFLLSLIAQLGEQYPLALDALRQRRDVAERRMVASPTDYDATSTFATINRVLKEKARTLAAFDQLPMGDPRRSRLGSVIFEDLIERKSYRDALIARPFASMSSSFEMRTRERTPSATYGNPDRLRDAMRDAAVSSALQNIEVLAGAGELADARTLAARLLEYDSSEGTRALLQERLARAGQPDLIAKRGP